VHADSAAKGLTRLEQLVQEAGVVHSKSIIGEAVNLIVYIEKENNERRVKQVIRVEGVKNEEYRITTI
jgi:type IV secretion system protein VirB11